MEFHEVVRARRMVRSYQRRELESAMVDRVLGAGLRGPSAGNTAGTEWMVLEGYDQTARYWDVCLPAERRQDFRWPGLLHAPVLVIPLAHPGAYLERYAEPDKAGSGLGRGLEAWPVPYWYTDTAMAAMAVLLAATAEGLGALFFGIFSHEDELLAS